MSICYCKEYVYTRGVDKQKKETEMNTFRDRLSVALRYARMSQTALAEKMGLSRAAVNLWLAEDDDRRTEPTLKTMYVASRYLGVDGDWLAKGVGDPPPDVAAGNDRMQRILYGHSSKSKQLLDDVVDAAKRINTDYQRYFDVALPLLFGADTLLTFDFVAPGIIAEIKNVEAVSQSPVAYRALWQLAIAARVDQEMHVERRHLLILQADLPSDQPLQVEAEAQLFGIEVLQVQTVEQIISTLKLL